MKESLRFPALEMIKGNTVLEIRFNYWNNPDQEGEPGDIF
jgi:hypothetical protein